MRVKQSMSEGMEKIYGDNLTTNSVATSSASRDNCSKIIRPKWTSDRIVSFPRISLLGTADQTQNRPPVSLREISGGYGGLIEAN